MDAAQSRRNPLGRLVARENSASDLVAFLFEMEPKPMAGLLSLEDSHHNCRREAQAQGTGKGRLDLVVRRQADGKAVALLEMKGASDLHGDQLDRYNSWAKRINPAPKTVLLHTRRRWRRPARSLAAAKPCRSLRRPANAPRQPACRFRRHAALEP
jgi:hypothetical protein